MAVVPQEAINQFESLMEEVDESLKRTFQKIHQGYPRETLMRFLKAREGNVEKAHKMLVDSLQWRVQNEIDDILAKPIVPVELYRKIRDSQLMGLSGYSYEGYPVFAVGVGLSTFDQASVHDYVQSHIQINEYRDHVILPAASKKYGRHISKCIKVLDMTGLRLSALDQIKLMTKISSIDDLNYPEKTLAYYIVNAPPIDFSPCWKVVKPLLQERTKLKIEELSGSGEDDLLKIMDHSSLPHFCRKRSSGSNCFSLEHPFHQQLYNYIKQQALLCPVKQGSIHVTLPEDAYIVKILESESEKIEDHDRFPESLKNLKINEKNSMEVTGQNSAPNNPPFHGALKFLVLLMLALAALKYAGKAYGLFEENPVPAWCFLGSAFAYSLVLGIMKQMTTSQNGIWFQILNRAAIVFGVFSTASVLSIFLPREVSFVPLMMLTPLPVVLAWPALRHAYNWVARIHAKEICRRVYTGVVDSIRAKVAYWTGDNSTSVPA